MIQRPLASEYPEYYQPYVNLVPEGDLLSILEDTLTQAAVLLKGISEEDGHFRYAAGKWSIKEVLGHMTDTERIMSYRLLRIGRGDQTPLAGFNENEYIEGSAFDQISIESILEDFTAARHATLSLIKNMPEVAWARIGVANNLDITTRAVAYIIAGHALHHLNMIKDRYLPILK